MSYVDIVAAGNALTVENDAFHVFHLSPPPPRLSRLRKSGLSRIASHPGLAKRIIGTTSWRLADRVADSPFSYGSRCRPGRYSNGFPALYTAHALSVALRELKHHLIQNGALVGGLKPRYVVLRATASGQFRNLTKLASKWQPSLVHATDYGPTQALGAAAVSAPLAFLIAPSARCSGGLNSPIFARVAVQAHDLKRRLCFFEKAGRPRHKFL